MILTTVEVFLAIFGKTLRQEKDRMNKNLQKSSWKKKKSLQQNISLVVNIYIFLNLEHEVFVSLV